MKTTGKRETDEEGAQHPSMGGDGHKKEGNGSELEKPIKDQEGSAVKIWISNGCGKSQPLLAKGRTGK